MIKLNTQKFLFFFLNLIKLPNRPIFQYKSQVTIEDKVTKVQEWLFERVREVLMKEIDNLGKIN